MFFYSNPAIDIILRRLISENLSANTGSLTIEDPNVLGKFRVNYQGPDGIYKRTHVSTDLMNDWIDQAEAIFLGSDNASGG